MIANRRMNKNQYWHPSLYIANFAKFDIETCRLRGHLQGHDVQHEVLTPDTFSSLPASSDSWTPVQPPSKGFQPATCRLVKFASSDSSWQARKCSATPRHSFTRAWIITFLFLRMNQLGIGLLHYCSRRLGLKGHAHCLHCGDCGFVENPSFWGRFFDDSFWR